jgi:hypothetical protein
MPFDTAWDHNWRRTATQPVKCNRCEAWTTPGPNHAATGTTCAKCQFPDQPAADRERIAAAANAVPGNHLWLEPDDLHRLDAAVRAFETLCEPKGWMWSHMRGLWYAESVTYANSAGVCVNGTRDHAADVCRLVCEVLDREAKEEKR